MLQDTQTELPISKNIANKKKRSIGLLLKVQSALPRPSLFLLRTSVHKAIS